MLTKIFLNMVSTFYELFAIHVGKKIIFAHRTFSRESA